MKTASYKKERAVSWVFYRVRASNTNLHVVEQNITNAVKKTLIAPQPTYLSQHIQFNNKCSLLKAILNEITVRESLKCFFTG